jgi:hypothetical protein
MIVRTLAAIVMVAALAGFTHVHLHAAEDAELKEIQSYRLTMPVLQKIGAAMRAFADAVKKDPAAQKQLEADDDKASDKQSLADMEHKIAAMPHMREALAAAGLTAHEYAVFEFCAFQAGMAAGLEKTGNLPNLPAGVQRANVQFMKDHEKECAAVMQGGEQYAERAEGRALRAAAAAARAAAVTPRAHRH